MLLVDCTESSLRRSLLCRMDSRILESIACISRLQKRMRYPALVADSVRPTPSNTNPHNMRTRIIKLLDPRLHRLQRRRRSTNHPRQLIHRHRTNQLSIPDFPPIAQFHSLLVHIDVHNPRIQQKLVLRQCLCHGLPNPAGAAMRREPERSVRPPIARRFIQNDVLGHFLEVWRRNAFP